MERYKMNSKKIFILILWLVLAWSTNCFAEVLRYHTLVLDGQNKILPWYSPNANAYDRYLYQLWQWLPTVPNYNGLPMYYLSCGFKPGSPITPDTWENDWGERVPNFVEFARLYYAYSGNTGPLAIAKGMVDYALAHGMTPAGYSWPHMAYGTANAGATDFNGDNVAWNRYDVLVDLSADMGMSFYKMYLIYGTASYRTAAINMADTLASKIVTGTSTASPWPYVVNAYTGATQSRYCSNWAGALTLFDLLIDHGEPNAAAYTSARTKLRNWILAYPMTNGKWVDGHSDVWIDGNTNLSNTAKSNMTLYLVDNPSFDPNFSTDVPALLQWTERNMVAVSTGDGLYGRTGVYYGAHVPAEQTAYMMRMGYQTARLAAEYARWYAISGNATHKDIAYRSFNYNTYMMKSSGESSDGPTSSVGYWWGDSYGEAARMYFHGFAGVPEWAPPGENHILYSKAVLKNVSYASGSVQYTSTDGTGIEYLRLAFLPTEIMLNGTSLFERSDLSEEGYTVRDLGNGDYAVNIRREQAGDVVVLSNTGPPPINQAPEVNITSPVNDATYTAPATVVIQADAMDSDGSVARVEFFQGNTKIGEDVTSPYGFTWGNVAEGSYQLSARATDNQGASTLSSVVDITVGTIPPDTTAWTELTYDDFESGWGNYTDGGRDCSLYTGGTHAHQGSNAANIQDNSGTASSFSHTFGVDVDTPGYTQIKVDFWFKAVSMDNSEDFWVQYYDGSTWHTVAAYARGTDFENDAFYHETVYVDGADYAFPTNMKFRFMCDASSDRDDVYIDEIRISARRNSSTLPDTAAPTVTAFAIPASADTLTVPITSFTATDDGEVTGYQVSESASAPSATDEGWSATAPASFTLTTEGTKTLYAWAKDAAGNVSAGLSASIVITLPGTADTTPPMVTFTLPVNDAVNVSITAPVTVTFNEPMDETTISADTFTLLDSSNTFVPATVTYDGTTKTATLIPSAPLSSSTTYTANIQGDVGGVTDIAGNALQADFTWSFTTVAEETLIYSIWDDATTPAILSDSDTNAVELGVKFRSEVDGYITGLLFYKSLANTGPHVGHLWTRSGTLLASIAFTNETSSGWQYQALSTPVAITANTTYVASYHTNVGRYSADVGYFAFSGVNSYPLRALADGEDGANGVYRYGAASSFPNSTWKSCNYWVDVEFQQ